MTDDKNIGEAIVAITLGILGGIALAKVLEYFLGARCPVCKKPISSNVRKCPHCKTAIWWK